MKAIAARTLVSNDPEKVQSFVDCFRANPVGSLISNLRTEIEQFSVGDLTFPISINSSGLDGNCYICDPITGYVDYAKDELRNFATFPILRSCLHGLVSAAAPMVHLTGLRDIVCVNNWLFSTNPVPRISREIASEIKETLTVRFPDKVIAIRSLNTVADQDAIMALSELGFRMLPARQIYIYPGNATPPGTSKNMKRDAKLLYETELQHVANTEFHERDFERIAVLYRMLYLEKYSLLNPQYTGLYVKEMHKRGLVELEGLRDRTGVLVAVTGLFENGNTLTQPIVGYDTARDIRDGLYRMVMAIAQQKAIQRGLFFNVSAGAARFKRLRRAVPAIEYTAVFDAHLSRRQQLAIGTLEVLLRRIGIPILQRFEL